MTEIHKPDAAIARLFLPQTPRRGIRYIPSQFALPFSHDGKAYAFHVLTKQCLETVLPETAYPGDGFDPLIEAMFLVPEDRDECAFYQSVSSMMRLYGQKRGIPNYTIMPTFGCNARCIYCFQSGVKRENMTAEIAEQTIRYIINTHASSGITLQWFGGEPLLCPDIIDRICQGLLKAEIPYRSEMITNGSLITPEILNKMLGLWKLKRIQISMDGDEPDYMTRKRYAHENDQYHTVIEAIDRMSEAGIPVWVRCNTDESNIESIPQFLNDLSEYIPHKKNVWVYCSPLMEVRAGKNDLAFWKKLINLRPLIEEAGFHSASFNGISMRFKTNRCMADGGGVVISPEGSLYLCEHCPPESRFGNIINRVTDEAARKEFCRTDRVREKCRSCPFLPQCTTFSSCPWKDTHCREVKKLIALDALKRMVERNLDVSQSDEDDLVC